MAASSRSASHLRIVSDRTQGELSEASLAEALRLREPWAAEVAWKRHASSVYGLLARGLGRRADAETLTQEVFLRLFTRIRALQEPAALKSFIYSHALVVMRRELRRRWLRHFFPGRNRALGSEEAKWLLDRPARLVLSRLYEVLDELSPNDRALFVLREIEGLSYGEIAEVLGKSVAFVTRSVTRVCGRVELKVRGDWLIEQYVAHAHPLETDRREGA